MSHMRQVAAAVVCWLALTACDGDSSANPDETTAPSTTSSTPTATSPTAPTAPVMPALAKQKSEAGAKAFIRYFAEVLNYSWASLESRDLTAMSARECEA